MAELMVCVPRERDFDEAVGVPIQPQPDGGRPWTHLPVVGS
jgi:hypothetical protein